VSRRLRFRGLVPAALVTFALAGALIAAPVGAAMHRFMSTAYPCTGVAASALPASPKPAGTSITITGNATCPSAGPMYEFWYLGQGSSTWQLVQGYSATTTYSWNSTGALAGNHVFSVWAKDATSGGTNSALGSTYDAYGNTTYVIQTSSCASVTAAASPPSPNPAGTAITITGTPGTCSNPSPLFQFWYLGQGSSNWQMVRDYSTVATYNWNSTGALMGNHIFSVWIKDAASSAAYDAYGNTTYTVISSCSASVAASASPTSPQPAGTRVTITATPGAGCPANPVFEFWYLGQGSSTWQLVQGYSANTTYSWNSRGALAGNHYWSAWVRDAGSPGANSALGSTYDAYSPLTYVITTPSCASVTVSAMPTTVASGTSTHVIVTAIAAGCTNANPLYEFFTRPSASLLWTPVQGFTPLATYDWVSTGAAPGTMYFAVWVRDANSTAAYDAFSSTFVNVT
jgi:hypothetical protein